MKYLIPLVFTGMLLAGCTPMRPSTQASPAEKEMAEMMGISVEELRNQTPEEHTQMMMQMHQSESNETSSPKLDIAALPEALPTETLTVADGDTITLNPTIVRKKIGGKDVAMYGYNGQIPGPIIRAKQAATITVDVQNNIDMDTTVHWHGLRHANKDDGVPDITQPTIQPAMSYSYTVRFPDEGVYWYHPHVREDIQQDMGLYGNIVVDSTSDDAYDPVNKEELLILDDRSPSIPSQKLFSLMGHFGNQMLINDVPAKDYKITVSKGSVVRFFITNVANARTFRLELKKPTDAPSGPLFKLVGSDVGRYDRSQWVDSLIIAPAERYIVDVLFNEIGKYQLRHATPLNTYAMGSITVTEEKQQHDFSAQFNTQKINDDVIEDIATYRQYFDSKPTKTLRLSIESAMGNMGHMMMSHASPDGIEWEDTMPMMNQMSTDTNTHWKLIDDDTGKENMNINWQFKKGDAVKIRIINDAESAHPMQHPIHLHGQRFLVLSDNDVKTENFAWKDTVLVPAGHTVDILVDMSNPGDWMMHCHIAEHLTNGMMAMFHVTE